MSTAGPPQSARHRSAQREATVSAPAWDGRLRAYRTAVDAAPLNRKVGRVSRLQGLAIEATGLRAAVGAICRIVPGAAAEALPEARAWGSCVEAEVVGVHGARVTLMAHGAADGLAAGAAVVETGRRSTIGVGPALLGRVIDGFGRPLDGRPAPAQLTPWPIKGAAVNPLQRPRIDAVLQTGVRCIDGMLTLGRGQRIGIFAGSGVGKSTLLGMVAQHVQADVNVIALVGERGREVREFIDKQLGVQGLRRSVVVVATADQPALARIRAAHAAVAIAEHFRAQGQQVLLTMDSVTRLAMAQREVGLAAGEPPTARGYTPSVFAELPQLCERCGTAPSGGAITALLTVLVEGDDMNEPIADCLRSVLDGHIVLSRQLAQQGSYPAIDVLASTSRLLPDLTTPAQQRLVAEVVGHLALLERNRQLVEIGAYTAGAHAALDRALSLQEALLGWLRQAQGGVPRDTALEQLQAILVTPRAAPVTGGRA